MRPAAAPATSRSTGSPRCKADTDVFTTFEGDNHVLLQLVAKGLLTDYASEFEDMDQFGMVRFVAGMAVETVIEKTNVHKLLERIKDVLPGGDQWDQEAGLLDPDYQLAMLRFREEHMLAGVARRLKRGIDQKMNPGVVFSRVQDHVIAAADAHVERLVLEAFVAKARSLPEGDLKVAVNLLCDLHALTTIEADRAWFMEHGRLTVVRSKAISREINSLCRKIRPLAGDLVDAFGVPAGDAALTRPDPRLTGAKRSSMKIPGLGSWSEDPLWGAFYDWTVEHPLPGGLLWRAGIGSDLGLLYDAAAEIGRQPAGARILDVPCGGGVALRGLRPGQGVEYVAADISPTMLDRTLASARRRGVDDQVTTRPADVEALPFEDGAFDLVVSFTGLHCFPDPRAGDRRDRAGAPARAGSSPAARCSTTPGCATHRSAPPAGWPGCSVRGAPASRWLSWLAAHGVGEVSLETSGAIGYFRGVKRG